MAAKRTKSKDKAISVLATDLPEPQLKSVSDRSLFRKAQDFGVTRVTIPADDLATQVKDFLDAMSDVIMKAPPEVGGFKLDSLTISVEISAKGTLSLLGTGGEVGGKGGLTFTLKR